jgi:hypothetical protein
VDVGGAHSRPRVSEQADGRTARARD